MGIFQFVQNTIFVLFERSIHIIQNKFSEVYQKKGPYTLNTDKCSEKTRIIENYDLVVRNPYKIRPSHSDLILWQKG